MLTRRIGKKTSLTFALWGSLAGSVILFVTSASLPLVFVIVPILLSPAAGLFTLLTPGIQADNTDYIEWQRGYRAEAAVAALASFITKAAGGVGGAIGAYMLAFFQDVPNAEAQAAGTIRGLFYINSAIPPAITLLAHLAWVFGYPLTKQATKQMMAERVRLRQHGQAGKSQV